MHEATENLLPLGHVESTEERVWINAGLWFIETDGSINIFLRGISLYRFPREDVRMFRYVAVHLRLDGHATQGEIARAFGHSLRTQMRWEQWYREDDLVGLDDGVPSGRPRAMSEGSRVYLVNWFEQGMTNREIGRRLGVSEATVRRELSRLDLSRPVPQQDALFDEEDGDDEGATSDGDADEGDEVDAGLSDPHEDAATAFVPSPGTLDTDPMDRVMDRWLARQGLLDDAAPLFEDAEKVPRAGVLLAVPLLAASGVLSVFEKTYGSLGAAFYGLRTTVVCLFLMALLRIRRPENLKEYRPADLGRVVGLDRMPEVKTVRRKLERLAAAERGEELMRALAKLRVEEDKDRVGFLYADGHVREYHGKHPVGKAHVTAKRISAPGTTDTWVNDAAGNPLFLVTSDLNAGLTKMLPVVLAEAKAIVGEGQRLTIVFDRGGYSPKLFADLAGAGFDLLTYRKGVKEPVAQDAFEKITFEVDGKTHTWDVHDAREVAIGTKRTKTKNRAAEPWLRMRQVTRLREGGEKQTQVLTTRTDLAPEEVLDRMFSRWRQENFFKYMKAEFSLDALSEYGAEKLSDSADRPNPDRRLLKRERQRVKVRLEKLLARLGEEVEENEESRRRTVRGLKIANADLRREIEEVTNDLEELTSAIAAVPKRVAATDLVQLKRHRRLVVDAIKMVAYQVESDLHGLLFGKYARAEDEGRTLLHAIFQSPARIEVGPDQLTVTIAAQSAPHRTEVVRQLCEELNEMRVKFPGSDLRLVLAAECPEHATV